MPEPTPLSPAGLGRLNAFLAGPPTDAALDLLSLLQPTGGAERRFGRFLLRRALGQGRFGIVFLADDPQRGAAVALKLPQPGVLLDAEHLRRFLREAEAAGALDHGGIVPVLEAGSVGPVPYLATAFIDGPTLDAWLRARPEPPPPRDAAALLLALAEAVGYAHGRGVLHCDLKPANVMLEPAGGGDGLAAYRPRVVDFGLARILQHTPDTTRTWLFAGSLPYMAPEQVRGRRRELTAACDIFALGVILHQLLTGRTPADGTKPLAAGPADLDAVVLRCLEKEPARRYASTADLADDLRRFLAGRPTLARLARRRRWWVRVGGLTAIVFAALVACLHLPIPQGAADPEWLAAREAEPAKARRREVAGGNGARWAIDDGHVSRWEGGGWVEKLPGGARALAVDFLGRAFVLTADRSLLLWRDDHWATQGQFVIGFATDEKGRLHTAASNGQVDVAEDGFWRTTAHAVRAMAGGPGGRVFSLTEDGRSWLWEAAHSRWVPTGGVGSTALAGGEQAAFRLDGDGGVSRWDGEDWRQVRAGHHRALLDGGDGAAWALQADGEVIRWDRERWRPVGQDVKALIADGAGAVFALAASGGAVSLWGGAGWRQTGPGGIESLLVDGQGGAWTLGRDGQVRRWGGEWRASMRFAEQLGVDEWGRLHARARDGRYFGWHDNEWTLQPSAVAANSDVLVFDRKRSEVCRYAAGRWRRMPLRLSQWAEAGRDVLAVRGGDREVVRYVGADGGLWRETGLTAAPNTLVSSKGETLVLEAGTGRVRRWAGGWVDTGMAATQVVPTGGAVLVVATAGREVSRYQGVGTAEWEKLGLTIEGRLVGVNDEVFALSGGKVFRYDGASFATVPFDERIRQGALEQ